MDQERGWRPTVSSVERSLPPLGADSLIRTQQTSSYVREYLEHLELASATQRRARQERSAGHGGTEGTLSLDETIIETLTGRMAPKPRLDRGGREAHGCLWRKYLGRNPG